MLSYTKRRNRIRHVTCMRRSGIRSDRFCFGRAVKLIDRVDWFRGSNGCMLASFSFLLKLVVGEEAPDALFRDKVIVAIAHL